MLFTTGMTRGELLALQWDKINWQKNKILVKYTLAQGEILKHTARNARREMDVPESLLTILKSWKKKSLKSEFIFPDKNGKYQDAEEMIKYKFNPLIEKAGMEEINFMSLRDTYAAILIQQNLPLTYIQQQLGHNYVKDTADRYKSLLDRNKPESLSFPEGIFG
jgi:integrase